MKIYVLNNDSSESSRDALGRFCQPYERIKIFDSKANLGANPGRNYMITHTEEDWLLFVDNDIIVATSHWFERFRSHVTTHPDAEAFVPKVFNAHENRHIVPPSLKITGNKVIFDATITDNTRNSFPGGASFVNRQLFDRLGLYDDRMFVGFSDFEISIRAIKSGNPIRVRLMPDIEFVHRHKPVTNELDRQATLVRYDYEQLEKSLNRIVEKHQVTFNSDWRDWVTKQRKQMLAR